MSCLDFIITVNIILNQRKKILEQVPKKIISPPHINSRIPQFKHRILFNPLKTIIKQAFYQIKQSQGLINFSPNH